jgi:hypothetical protein
MAEYNQKFDESNRGTLFKDEKTERDPETGVKVNERDRDHSGQLNVVCPKCGVATDYWISAWVNVAKASGKKFFSMRVKVKDGTDARPVAPRPKPVPLKDDLSDEIPF